MGAEVVAEPGKYDPRWLNDIAEDEFLKIVHDQAEMRKYRPGD